MVILITGATHTGKTLLAQKLLEKHHYPYLSIDHLKMGLIRSGQTKLTTEDDNKLTDYLWPIVREMIKTAIENNQNLIVEGCYIPFDNKNDFTHNELDQIKYVCLIFSESYIKNHYGDIKKFENVIEYRENDDYPIERMIRDNKYNLRECQKQDCKYILINDKYEVDFDL